jgi:hypothetical protein
MIAKYGMQYTRICGAIAQLGERIVRNDEVVSSILTSSTKDSAALQAIRNRITFQFPAQFIATRVAFSLQQSFHCHLF